MLDIWDILMETGPAIKKDIEFGKILREDDFLELPNEFYEKCWEQLEYAGETIVKTQKLFYVDPRRLKDDCVIEIVSKEEIDWFIRAANYIDRFCEKSQECLLSDDDKLRYVAANIPSVFSENTPYHH